MLPCRCGRSATELSVTESCHGRGGDKTKMLPESENYWSIQLTFGNLNQSSGGQMKRPNSGGTEAVISPDALGRVQEVREDFH